VTLPAFAAERRAAAPLLLGARRRAHSNKPAARRRLAAAQERTDRQRDGHRIVTQTLPHTRRICTYSDR